MAQPKETPLQSLQAKVLELVVKYPGKTARELARAAGENDPRRINRRLSELCAFGHITRGSVQKCKVTGKLAVTWFRGDR